MATAYTPGLEVTASTVVQKIRELPLPGTALVKVGDVVEPSTAVLSAELPGDIHIVRVSDRMGFDPADVVPGMKVQVGSVVQQGDLLCELKTFFGWFTSQLTSPASGVVEFFTEANAHLAIRGPSSVLKVDAYVPGVVVEVDAGKSVTVETEGAFIQGIFGVGGECLGEILALDVPGDALVTEAEFAPFSAKLKGRIVVGGSRYESSTLAWLGKEGVAAVVVGSIDSATLRAFVGYDIGVSITGDEAVPFTLIVTEGFGTLAMSKRIIELAKSLDGRRASVNGATQVRAGAMRPELIVPNVARSKERPTELLPRTLSLGSKVRIIRVPYFGEFAEVTQLPNEPEAVPSGAVVRVLRARLESGKEVTVPRANVELV